MIGKATTHLLGQYVRNFAIVMAVGLLGACGGMQPAGAAPYSAHVMDARTGETLYSDHSETRLHPASLTKMMTL
jgi:D-alanyl-D-alanine carboxypeptidase